MNEIMKMMTIIAIIFITTTFVAGIYGMNYDLIPELKWKYNKPKKLGKVYVNMVVSIISKIKHNLYALAYNLWFKLKSCMCEIYNYVSVRVVENAHLNNNYKFKGGFYAYCKKI